MKSQQEAASDKFGAFEKESQKRARQISKKIEGAQERLEEIAGDMQKKIVGVESALGARLEAVEAKVSGII